MVPTQFALGTIVTIKNDYHVRGGSTGVVEAIDPRNGFIQVWWESDQDNQIHPAARSYLPEELIEKNEVNHPSINQS